MSVEAKPTAPSGEQWTIRNGDHEAVIVQVGGGIRSYTVAGEPVLHGYAEDAKADAGRGQLLMPWPNRIRDGRYSFDGKDEQLALSEPGRANASHGLVRWALWSLLERSESSLTVSYSLLPQQGWDWSLDLRVTYVLSDEGLVVTPSATNVGMTPAPFGFGAHPYLTAGEESVDELTLTLPAATVIEVDDRLIPTGSVAVPTDLDFREPRSLRGVELDHAFTDLAGEVVSIRDHFVPLLDQRGAGLAVDSGQPDQRGAGLAVDSGQPGQRGAGWAVDSGVDQRGAGSVWTVSVARGERVTSLWADAAAYPYAQVFTGDSLPEAKRRHTGVAVEPMTCPANAFATGESLITLEPGQTWSAPWGVVSG